VASPKRVGVVVANLKPYGGQRVALTLAEAIAPNAVVVLITFDPKTGDWVAPPSGTKHVALQRRHRGQIANLLLVAQLARTFRREQLDLVISFMTLSNLCCLAGAMLCRKARRVVVTEHSIPSISIPTGERHPRVMANAMRLLYPRAGAVVGVSSPVVRDLDYFLRWDPGRVRRIFNPFDADRVIAAATIGSNESQESTLGETIVCVARMKRAKGHETLLHALRELPSSYRLKLVGDGPLEPELRRLAAELGVSSRVAFAGWSSNPYPEMLAADVVVLPSAWEGFGLVALEAAALGRPFVGTDVGGLSEVMRLTGAEGVPPDDPGALRAAILRAGNRHPCDEWRVVTSPADVAEQYLRLLDRSTTADGRRLRHRTRLGRLRGGP
jgi:glycosyltransferase involved in cell wall biosynthesis